MTLPIWDGYQNKEKEKEDLLIIECFMLKENYVIYISKLPFHILFASNSDNNCNRNKKTFLSGYINYILGITARIYQHIIFLLFNG